MNFLFVIDPPSTLNLKKDSTIALIEGVLGLGGDSYICEQKDLFFLNGKPFSRASRVRFANLKKFVWEEEGKKMELVHFNFIFMRKDPPVDQDYLHATRILSLVDPEQTQVLNSPSSLRNFNEKLLTLKFLEFCPPTLLGHKATDLKEFVAEHKKVVVKPLDGMGGRSIFCLNACDGNLPVVVENLTRTEGLFYLSQKYIPEISNGDKRILMAKGKAIPYALSRIPSPDDFRGNLAAGARPVGSILTDRELEICEAVGPFLIKEKIFLAGLDVIGDFLTEINITSPTGIREINSAFGLKLHRNIIQLLFDPEFKNTFN